MALSLHAPNDELRNQLVPLNKKYPIADLLAATRRYLSGLPDKRKATIEYTVIENTNDQPEHARQLAVCGARVCLTYRCRVHNVRMLQLVGVEMRAALDVR